MGRSIAFDGGIAARYDRTRGGDVRAAKAAEAAVHWLPEGPVVEIGVGTGIIAEALAARGRRPVGIDLSPEMLAQAATRLPGRIVRADAVAPPVRDGVAAGVVAIHVLHLVADLCGVVGAAARLLRPGGRLVTSGLDGDRYSEDELTDAHGDIDVRLRRFPPPTVDQVVAAGASSGLRLVHDGFQDRLTFGRSPNQAAHLLEKRTWSWCWDLDDATWAADVQPVIDRLRALPDPDRPRPEWMERRYIVMERH